jgi:hypothetical protein
MAKKRKVKRKSTPVNVDTLRALRVQLGTKELAKRMGIPPASLRRLVGSGKSAGFPKQKPKWETVGGQRKLVAGHAFHTLVQRVGAARMSPERAARDKAARRAQKAAQMGELDSLYNDIADELGLEPKEVYTLGVSPGQMGEVA